MENLFLKYMKERTGKRKSPEISHVNPGPVITLSREYGCPAHPVANKLAETLTEKNRLSGIDTEWRVISKEIIEESAKELNLSPSLANDLSEYKRTGFFENLALFFSEDYYPGDAKIKNTIAKIIFATAVEGNVIIIGRAGEAITKNIVKSFHTKLIAPIDWRARSISNSEGLSFADAKKRCLEQDRRREQFRDYFEKDKPDVEFFDITFNCRSLSDTEIVELLVIIAETHGFI